MSKVSIAGTIVRMISDQEDYRREVHDSVGKLEAPIEVYESIRQNMRPEWRGSTLSWHFSPLVLLIAGGLNTWITSDLNF